MSNKKKFSYVIFLILLVLPVGAQDKPDALVAFRAGRYIEAETICLAELAEDPTSMNSYSVLCWSLQARGKYADALKYALQGLGVTKDIRLLYAAAEALFFLGRNSDSLKYFEEYITIVPSGEKIRSIYYYMGEIYIRLGKFNNADISFSTALHYSGNNAELWSRLGYAREMAKQYQWSLDAYDKALQLNPGLEEAKLGKERVSKLING